MTAKNDHYLAYLLESLDEDNQEFVKIYHFQNKSFNEAALEAYKQSVEEPLYLAYMFMYETEEGKEVFEYLKQQQIVDEGITQDWKKQKLVNIVEATTDPSNVNFQPGVGIKGLAELNKMDGDYAPVNIRVETTLDIIGYDFSAMNKPKIIEAEVTKSIPASIDFALPPNYITAREEFANV